MRWIFGVEPLPQTLTAASLVRSVVGLALSLEAPQAALDRLIDALRAAEAELSRLVPRSPLPRVGAEAPADGRPYVDHSRDIGAFNPFFPAYEIRVDGDHATGTVSFPVAYEGPPGLVHGGFLALFFDSAVQHHNCELGLAGKTTSLTIKYRRPTPLLAALRFEVDRSVEDRRITSQTRLLHEGAVLCEAEVRAVAGNRAALPEVSPRREA